MLVVVDLAYVINTGLAIGVGIWAYKFSRAVLEFIIDEYGRKKRRPPQ